MCFIYSLLFHPYVPFFFMYVTFSFLVVLELRPTSAGLSFACDFAYLIIISKFLVIY